LRGVRVGVPVLWFNAVLKGLVKLKSSASCFDYSVPTTDAIEAGFKHVELVMNMCYLLPNGTGCLNKSVKERLKTIGDANDLTYSVHLPFWSVDASSHIQAIRKASSRTLAESIDSTVELEPKAYVLHATGALAADIYSQRIKEEQKQACLKIFSENSRLTVEELVDHLTSVGISSRRLALESVKFPFRHSLALANEFDTSICIDVGHILAGYSGDVSLREAFYLSRGRIAEVHVHDVLRNVKGSNAMVKDHLPLGSGVLSVRELLFLLKSTAFDGPMILEMKFEDACSSLEELKSIIA